MRNDEVNALSVAQRADFVMWIMQVTHAIHWSKTQAFGVLGLDEALVHGVVLNIDRQWKTPEICVDPGWLPRIKAPEWSFMCRTKISRSQVATSFRRAASTSSSWQWCLSHRRCLNL